MRSRETLLLRASWLLGDAAAIYLALNFAFNVRYNIDWIPLIDRLTPITERYAIMIPASVFLWLILFAVNGLYDPRYLLSGLAEYGKVVSGCTLGILVLIVLSFVEPNLSVSRSWLVFSWFSSILFVSAVRFAIRRGVQMLRARGRMLRRAVIVGANEHAQTIARQLSPATASGVQVVGFLDDYLPRDTRVVDDLRILDRPAALARVAVDLHVAEAIVVQGAIAWESFMEIITQSTLALDGLEIKLSPGFYEIMATGVRLSHDGFVPLLALEKNRITGFDALLKALLDYSVGLVALIVLSPVMALIALVVRLIVRGSIVESYEVLGVREKPFTTWKFKTRSEEMKDHVLGYPLYRSGLDKLPQVFNVLRGEMSLVGPRPIPTYRAQVYHEMLPTLLTVRPGLTGPWVVDGAAVDSLEAEIRLDLYYIRNWTIWLDLQIILQTVLRLFQGQRPAVKR
ncbi:MAG: sugar transferase [Chloroflexi bacterium]|nr:sugar transferase [Chloroflexota bacterium]